MSRFKIALLLAGALLPLPVSLPSFGAKKSAEIVFAEPRQDKALVYFIRKGSANAALCKMHWFVEDRYLGQLGNGSYTFAYIEPKDRKRFLWMMDHRMRRYRLLEVELSAGKTYYVGGTIMRMLKNTNQWLLSENEGTALLEQVKRHVSQSGEPPPKHTRDKIALFRAINKAEEAFEHIDSAMEGEDAGAATTHLTDATEALRLAADSAGDAKKVLKRRQWMPFYDLFAKIEMSKAAKEFGTLQLRLEQLGDLCEHLAACTRQSQENESPRTPCSEAIECINRIRENDFEELDDPCVDAVGVMDGTNES